MLPFVNCRLIIIMLLLCIGSARAQRQIIDGRMHHLRNGVNREWNEFPIAGAKGHLSVSFNAKHNTGAGSIQIRQYEVKQPWLVMLNNQQIGKLTEDEKDLTMYLEVPPGVLRDGVNTLQIKPVNEAVADADDIRVGELSYYAYPLNDLLAQCKITVHVRDKRTNELIPARITITNIKGTLQTVQTDTAKHLAGRAGTVYTATGNAGFGLSAGTYKIYATRGFEYGVDSVTVVLKKADHINRTLIIEREVNTKGWVSADTHLHSLTYSGHGDATIEERAISIAGEGIEVPIITEHNKAIDIKGIADKLQLNRWYTPVTGNEVTTTRGHFNIFPVDTAAKLIDHKSADWNTLHHSIRQTGTTQAVILNHAEDIHNNFRPFDPGHHIAVAGMMLADTVFPGNAMEVVNAGSQQKDILQLYYDWFGMMNGGYLLTPVGSSDSHDVIRFMAGQSRTYIKADDTDCSAININEVTSHFLQGKVMVSFGLLTRMMVNKKYEPGDLVPGNEKIVVSIEVSGPKWTNATQVSLFANGKKIRQAKIKTGTRQVIKWKGTWTLPPSAQDYYLVAIAEGKGNDLPFWKINKPYQKTSPQWNPKLIGSTGAIWIDGDGDGARTTANAYAKSVIATSGSDIDSVISKLALYDEAVSIQAAALLWKNGFHLEGPVIQEAIKKASGITKSGFQTLIKASKKL